jgi:hypothetical protein
MTFEEFVRDSIDKGEVVADPYLHVDTTEAMLKYIASHISSQQINRTFIYNYEDNKCYYFYDKKLYRLSVNFEEVKI